MNEVIAYCEEYGVPLVIGSRFCEACGTPVYPFVQKGIAVKATDCISKSGFLRGQPVTAGRLR